MGGKPVWPSIATIVFCGRFYQSKQKHRLECDRHWHIRDWTEHLFAKIMPVIRAK